MPLLKEGDKGALDVANESGSGVDFQSHAKVIAFRSCPMICDDGRLKGGWKVFQKPLRIESLISVKRGSRIILHLFLSGCLDFPCDIDQFGYGADT